MLLVQGSVSFKKQKDKDMTSSGEVDRFGQDAHAKSALLISLQISSQITPTKASKSFKGLSDFIQVA